MTMKFAYYFVNGIRQAAHFKDLFGVKVYNDVQGRPRVFLNIFENVHQYPVKI